MRVELPTHSMITSRFWLCHFPTTLHRLLLRVGAACKLSGLKFQFEQLKLTWVPKLMLKLESLKKSIFGHDVHDAICHYIKQNQAPVLDLERGSSCETPLLIIWFEAKGLSLIRHFATFRQFDSSISAELGLQQAPLTPQFLHIVLLRAELSWTQVRS